MKFRCRLRASLDPTASLLTYLTATATPRTRTFLSLWRIRSRIGKPLPTLANPEPPRAIEYELYGPTSSGCGSACCSECVQTKQDLRHADLQREATLMPGRHGLAFCLGHGGVLAAFLLHRRLQDSRCGGWHHYVGRPVLGHGD